MSSCNRPVLLLFLYDCSMIFFHHIKHWILQNWSLLGISFSLGTGTFLWGGGNCTHASPHKRYHPPQVVQACWTAAKKNLQNLLLALKYTAEQLLKDFHASVGMLYCKFCQPNPFLLLTWNKYNELGKLQSGCFWSLMGRSICWLWYWCDNKLIIWLYIQANRLFAVAWMAFSKYIFFNNTINTDSAIINLEYVAEFLSCLQFF